MNTNEWMLLQNQFENYEKWSLVIKLMAIIVVIWSLAFSIKGVIAALLLFVLWLQDSIEYAIS